MTTKNKILREVENFTDQNSAHYFQVFQKFSNGDGIFTLNIPVLFIGSFWFFYRKMVLLGSLILISTFLIFVFIIIFFKDNNYVGIICSIVLVIWRVLITSIADYLYWKIFFFFLENKSRYRRSNYIVGTSSLIPIVVLTLLISSFYWLLTGMMQGMRHT